MKTVLPFFAIVFCLCGCTKQAQKKETTCRLEPGTVTLPLTNCVEKSGQNDSHSLCFVERVEDSRCPANVVCVWSGVAVVKFSLNANGTTQQFSLSTLNSVHFPPRDTVIAGYGFELLDVLPYPSLPVSAEPVRAVVRITR